MYTIDFYVKEYGNKNHVMILDIEGDSRTEVIYNILESNWEQQGEFQIFDYEWEDLIYDFVQILCNVEKYEDKEAEYRLKLHGEFNLDLTPLLNDSDKDITSEGIIDIFCDIIKESWLYDNDTLEISYKIRKN